MAKARSKSGTSGSRRFSVATLYILAVICFVISRLFAKVEAVNYSLAIIGFLLFGFAFYNYFRSSKRR